MSLDTDSSLSPAVSRLMSQSTRENQESNMDASDNAVVCTIHIFCFKVHKTHEHMDTDGKVSLN